VFLPGVRHQTRLSRTSIKARVHDCQTSATQETPSSSSWDRLTTPVAARCSSDTHGTLAAPTSVVNTICLRYVSLVSQSARFPLNSGSTTRSIGSSVISVRLTLRDRLQCSICSTVCPGCTFVIGPNVSISRNSLLVKVSNEQPKSV